MARKSSRPAAAKPLRGLAVSKLSAFGEVVRPAPRRAAPSQAKRILLFHMGGVLGHLHRVLALAEEIDLAGHEAILATSDGALPVLRALKPGVRLVEAYDDPGLKAVHARLASTAAGRGADRSNLHGMGPRDAAGRAELAGQMARMAAADRALIELIKPDAVVVDHRFTAWPADRGLRDSTFHVSSLLGLPSLHRRVTGRLPYPLGEAKLLVPGIRQIECWRRKDPSAAEPGRISMCGPFRWKGWARLRRTQAALPPAEALFFFGSTGEAERARPVLRRAAGGWLNFRWVGQARPGVMDGPGEPAVDLERGLASAELLICHGGHGTVMEALMQARPVIVIPSNPEQLEIGQRIETIGLGLLVRQSLETITGADLAALVTRARGDDRMRRKVEQYSGLLRQSADGARRAAGIVLGHLGAELSRLETAD